MMSFVSFWVVKPAILSFFFSYLPDLLEKKMSCLAVQSYNRQTMIGCYLMKFHRPTDQVLEAPFIWKCLSRHAGGIWGTPLEHFSEWSEACGVSGGQLEPRCALNQLICQLTLCSDITNWAVYISCPTHLLILCCCCCSPCCSDSCCFSRIRTLQNPWHLLVGSIYLLFPRGLLLISACSCSSWLKKKMLPKSRERSKQSGAREEHALEFFLNKTFLLSAWIVWLKDYNSTQLNTEDQF